MQILSSNFELQSSNLKSSDLRSRSSEAQFRIQNSKFKISECPPIDFSLFSFFTLPECLEKTSQTLANKWASNRMSSFECLPEKISNSKFRISGNFRLKSNGSQSSKSSPNHRKFRLAIQAEFSVL